MEQLEYLVVLTFRRAYRDVQEKIEKYTGQPQFNAQDAMNAIYAYVQKEVDITEKTLQYLRDLSVRGGFDNKP